MKLCVKIFMLCFLEKKLFFFNCNAENKILRNGKQCSYLLNILCGMYVFHAIYIYLILSAIHKVEV